MTRIGREEKPEAPCPSLFVMHPALRDREDMGIGSNVKEATSVHYDCIRVAEVRA